MSPLQVLRSEEPELSGCFHDLNILQALNALTVIEFHRRIRCADAISFGPKGAPELLRKHIFFNYKRNPSGNGLGSMSSSTLASADFTHNPQLQSLLDISSRKSAAEPSHLKQGGRTASVKLSQSVTSGGIAAEQQPQVYELSLKQPSQKAKPSKLKPLAKNKKGDNLADSLLQNDKPKKFYEDGETEILIPTSAELDKEMKDYMDAGKIFKQLKTAFNPSNPFNTQTVPDSQEDEETDASSKMSRTVGGGSKRPLEPIVEETQIANPAQQKMRQRKVEQLLQKVKKATEGDGKKGKDKVLALPPSTSLKPEKDGTDTFMTSCLNQQNKTDEDLTEEALLKQYEELMQKGEVKKEKKKGKKSMHIRSSTLCEAPIILPREFILTAHNDHSKAPSPTSELHYPNPLVDHIKLGSQYS